MDKKTRVLNCIDGKPIDRVPYCFWEHFAGEDAHGMGCVRAHKRWYDETGIDFIKMQSDGYFQIGFNETVRVPSDWAKLKIPDMKSEFVQGQIERAKRTRDIIQDEACIFYLVFAAFSFLWKEYDKEMVISHLRDGKAREYLLPLLDNLGDFVAEFAEKLITEGGVTGIDSAMSTNYRFTVAQYRAWLRPQDEKLLNAVNRLSNYNIIHLCGWDRVKNNFESWGDYAGAVMHWDQHTEGISLAEGKVLFKNTRAIMGGFDHKPGTVLFTGSKEEIQALTKEYVRSGGKTGFILSADCSLMEHLTQERAGWVREALEQAAQEC